MFQPLLHLGKQFPKSVERKADTMMNEAGSEYPGAYFIGLCAVILAMVLIITLVLCFFPAGNPLNQFIKELAFSMSVKSYSLVMPIVALAFSAAVLFFSWTMIMTYYMFKADARRAAIENVLPEFLSMVSSNVRGGMPIDQALWNSAKPEFGILAEEVRRAIKESYSGKTLNDALDDLANRFGSKLFKRFIEILKQAISSGAEVGIVLEKLSEEMREVMIVRKDIRAMLIVYVIFLFFAAAFGVPFLLAVSNKLVETLTVAFSMVDTSGASTEMAQGSFLGNFYLGKPPISPLEFYYFSLITIFITNFITAYIIGAAYTGNENDGIKFFIFMVIIAYLIFFAGMSLVSTLFTGFGI